MTPLKANLKHLYQRPGLWLCYIFVLGFIIPLFIVPVLETNKPGTGKFIGYLFISVITGIFMAGMQQEILSKPFSFCLPNHRRTSRKFILIVGAVLSALLSLIFIAYPQLTFVSTVLAIFSAAATGLAIYMICSSLFFLTPSNKLAIGFVCVTVILIIGGSFGLNKIVENIIVNSPILMTIFGVSASALIFKRIATDSIARQTCGKLIPGTFDAWNTQKALQYRYQQLFKKIETSRHPGILENFFMPIINRYPYLNPARCIWASTYVEISKNITLLRPAHLLIYILLVMLSGYINSSRGPGSAANILFVLPTLFAVVWFPKPCPGILLPTGRKHDFYGALASAVAMTLLTLSFITIMLITSNIIEPIIPTLKIYGHSVSYHAMQIRYFYVPLILIPINLTIATLFQRRHFLKVMLAMIFMYPAMIFLISRPHPLPNMILPTASIPPLIILSWLIFLLVLNRFFKKSQLTGQAKTY
ncbi:MAG: hypothetical protein ACYSWP_09550 [Planctomycetota bacterium]|jgi:hypothetical protein